MRELATIDSSRVRHNRPRFPIAADTPALLRHLVLSQYSADTNLAGFVLDVPGRPPELPTAIPCRS